MVEIAVRITIKSGMLANLAKRPIKTRKPQAISKVPTKCAVKAGYGNPIFANRRIPMDGSMYLRIPCVKKIKPTASRMKTMLLAFQAGARSLLISIPLMAVPAFGGEQVDQI